MIKVINGMSEKIEVFKIMFIDTMTERINKCFNKFDKIDNRLDALEDKLKNRCDYIDKHNRVHFDAMAEKIEVLENKLNNNDCEHYRSKDMNELKSRIINLEDKYKYMFNNKDVKHLIERCDDLVKVDNNIIECMDDLEAKLNKLDNICVEQYDVLEAKNYQIKSDLDKLTNNGGNNE